MYTGITKQSLNKRLYQHNYVGNDFENLIPVKNDLTRNQARSIEQYYIDNGVNEYNKINSIAKQNKFYQLSQ